MRCHYEVLDIDRDSDDSAVKTAYKKLALKWHPDKNLNNPDEAKEQFQLVQQAYEILSDRQERAWYDNHREQILRGSNKDFEDKSLDVFPYFTTTCFKGYDDDDNGFYAVYRRVFEEIAKEDLEFMDKKDEFCTIPMFGTSTSDYDETVNPFYCYWMAYSTKRSYVWLDEHDIRDVRNKKLLKLIEKAHKKTRQEAKKERNEEVRNLVAFIRKRDKRVVAHTKQMQAKIVENRSKHKELSKQKRLEKLQTDMQTTQAEWTKFDNVQKELENIEKSLVSEFGKDSYDEESEPEDVNNLYCVACNKVFKTPKAFENHESSKKHRENVDILKESMRLEEDADSDVSNASNGDAAATDVTPIDGNGIQSNSYGCEDNSDSVASVIDDDDPTILVESRILNDKTSKKKQKKNRNVLTVDVETELEILKQNSTDSEGDTFDFGKSRKQKKKSRRSNASKESVSTISTVKVVVEETQTEMLTKKKRDKTKNASNGPAVDADNLDKDHCCVKCKQEFGSKNKLFQHLKKTGHSTYITPAKEDSGGSRVKTKIAKC